MQIRHKFRRKGVEKLKTEQEIINEIDACLKTIENYKNAYAHKKLRKNIAQLETVQFTGMILALKWVLGENDRFD
jgi:ribosomal protein L29